MQNNERRPAQENEPEWDTQAVIHLIKEYIFQYEHQQKIPERADRILMGSAGVAIAPLVAIRESLMNSGVSGAQYMPTHARRAPHPEHQPDIEPITILITLPLSFRSYLHAAEEIIAAITQDNTQPPRITMVTCATTATTFSEGHAQVTQLVHTVQENGTEVAVVPALHSAESALTRYTSQFGSRHRLVLHLCTGRNTADLGTPEPLAPGAQLSADHEGTLQLFYAPLSGELGIIKS